MTDAAKFPSSVILGLDPRIWRRCGVSLLQSDVGRQPDVRIKSEHDEFGLIGAAA